MAARGGHSSLKQESTSSIVEQRLAGSVYAKLEGGRGTEVLGDVNSGNRRSGLPQIGSNPFGGLARWMVKEHGGIHESGGMSQQDGQFTKARACAAALRMGEHDQGGFSLYALDGSSARPFNGRRCRIARSRRIPPQLVDTKADS